MKELTVLLKQFSPEELAAKLGLARSTVYYWANGQTVPSRMARVNIMELFSKSLKSKAKGVVLKSLK